MIVDVVRTLRANDRDRAGFTRKPALDVQRRIGTDSVVVTVFPDSNKKYLSTGLLSYEPAKPGHMSPHVRVLGFRALSRVCGSCTDPTPLALGQG